MKLITVGCSFTSGVGVKNNETYTHKLAELLNCNYENYGEAGHSNKYIFRKSIELLKNWNKDDILIIQWTNPMRDEIITNEGYLFYPPYPTFVSLAFLYGKNPGPALQKLGIFEKADYDKSIIEKKQNDVINYCEKFFNKKYQLDLSFCYQISLFGLLETLGIKYINFFGWESEEYETQKEIFSFTNEKFLNDTFGEYVKNPPGGEHPDKDMHKIWANYLYNKIKEFNYINYNKLI